MSYIDQLQAAVAPQVSFLLTFVVYWPYCVRV